MAITGTATNEELAARAKGGDQEAVGALWEQNKGLLVLMMRKLAANPGSAAQMRAAGVTLEDLEQESYFAIQAAVDLYDPQAGAKFATFLRYPVMTAFFNAIGMRTVKGRKDPLSSAISLDEPLSTEDGEGSERGELIPDPAAAVDFKRVEEQIYTQQLRAALEDCLDRIPPNNAQIIRGRYFEGQTARAIGERLGVSAAYVGDLQKAGLRQLRHQAHRLQAYREETIQAKAYRGTGWGAWANGGSVEERTIELLERRGLFRAPKMKGR